MYKNQRYNTREASVIATGFPVVCVSFFIVVAKTASIMHLGHNFFLTSLLVTYGVTAITARLYPLAGKSAGYYREGEGVPEENRTDSSLRQHGQRGCGSARMQDQFFQTLQKTLKIPLD